MGGGVLSVMMNGMILMLKWSADSWDWGKKSVTMYVCPILHVFLMPRTSKY